MAEPAGHTIRSEHYDVDALRLPSTCSHCWQRCCSDALSPEGMGARAPMNIYKLT